MHSSWSRGENLAHDAERKNGMLGANLVPCMRLQWALQRSGEPRRGDQRLTFTVNLEGQGPGER